MSDAAPTEEAVMALLDYLVDPMLPLKAQGRDPPSLAHQHSVAKQMHAVVILYNYYHRKQHPQLCFLEYESFCKLALTLKPALMAHMKLTHQADSTRLNDLESQLSVTEKAIMDACNTSLSLDTLKDVPSTEEWPISKVSVLLIDSKKENCVLLYDSITNGVWSVIEKCLDVSNIDLKNTSGGKNTSVGKQANKKKRMGKKTVTNEQLAESGFEQLAFGAVKEATGINQSELMVLERHVVYSLSKEKTAAYFYILQCTSNEDIQVPIKETIESLQGPLFKWISRSWTLTSVVEYYNVLPYAMILSSWYSREFLSNSLQSLNVSSPQKTEESHWENFSEREQVISNALQNRSVELENIKVNSSQMLENPCYGEANKDRDSNDGNCNYAKFCGNETIVTEKSKMADEDAQETEQSDESWDITHPTVKQLERCIGAYCSDKDGINTVNSKRIKETEKHDILLDINQSAVKKLENCVDIDYRGQEIVGIDSTKRLENKAEDTEKSDTCEATYSTVKELRNPISAISCGEETIDADNSKGIKQVVEDTEKSDKSCAAINSTINSTISIDSTKRLENKAEDTEKSDTCEATYSTVKELRNPISAISCGEETIDADNSKGIKQVVEDTEKSDKSCAAINSTINSTISIDSTKRLENKVEDTEKSDTCEATFSTVKQLRNPISAISCGEETIDADSSKGIKQVVEDTEKSDKSCDAINSTVNSTIGIDNTKRLENKVEDTEKSDTCEVTYATVKELRNSMSANSSGEETIDADNSKEIKQVVEDTEKSDKPCDAINSTVNSTIGIDNTKRLENKVEDTEKSDTCEVTYATVKELRNSASANSSGEETIDADNSKEIKQIVEDTEMYDKSCDAINSTVNSTIGIDNTKRLENKVEDTEKSDTCEVTCATVKELRNSMSANSSVEETIDADNSKEIKQVVEDTEMSDKSCDAINSTVYSTIGIDNTKRLENKVEDTEKSDTCEVTCATVKELRNSMSANSSGEETIDADNSKEIKQIVEDTEMSDKSCDAINSTVNSTIGIDNTKRLENKVVDTEKSDTCEVTYSTAKELRNSTSANSSGEETIYAVNSKEIKQVVEDTEKSYQSCDAINSTVKKLSNDDSSKQGPISELWISSLPPGKRQKMDEDGVNMNFDKDGDKNKNADVPMRVYHHQKRKIPKKSDARASVRGDINVETAGSAMSNASKSTEGKVSGNGIYWTIPYNLNRTQVADSAPVCIESNARSVETLQATLATKDTAMTQTALGFLFSKRAKLCHQQRLIQDEIALCDRNIQKILEGNEDALALKLDAIMDGCNDACFKDKTQEESYQHGEGHHLNQCTTEKRISDAIFNLRSPSQDLTDICRENNWMAKYSVSAADGGFVANLTVKGMDFDCSCLSELLSTPKEAKDSAAAGMIAELQAMAGHT